MIILEELEIRKKNRDHLENNNVKISQNTWKSPGNLRRLAISQTSVKKKKKKKKKNTCEKLAKSSSSSSIITIIIIISQNTKSPGDLRRLVTQTPVRNHQLMLM